MIESRETRLNASSPETSRRLRTAVTGAGRGRRAATYGDGELMSTGKVPSQVSIEEPRYGSAMRAQQPRGLESELGGSFDRLVRLVRISLYQKR